MSVLFYIEGDTLSIYNLKIFLFIIPDVPCPDSLVRHICNSNKYTAVIQEGEIIKITASLLDRMHGGIQLNPLQPGLPSEFRGGDWG